MGMDAKPLPAKPVAALNCERKPPAVLVVPKSFSYAQKNIRAKRGPNKGLLRNLKQLGRQAIWDEIW